MTKKNWVALLLITVLVYLPMRGEVKNLSWFKKSDCSQLTITKFKSIAIDKVVASVEIQEKEAIRSIMDRIRTLPTEGDEMISWGPKSPRTVLSFRCGEETQEIEIFSGHFKTPATSFISGKNGEEEKLVADLEALVAPKLNGHIPKLKNHPFKFKNFSVTFIESKHTPQSPEGPTLGPSSRNFYRIHEESSANLVTLDIFDGQIPPQPQAFAIGKKIYYLLTFQSVGGESLYPNHFSISETLPKR